VCLKFVFLAAAHGFCFAAPDFRAVDVPQLFIFPTSCRAAITPLTLGGVQSLLDIVAGTSWNSPPRRLFLLFLFSLSY
jgi:hypothetical protein